MSDTTKDLVEENSELFYFDTKDISLLRNSPDKDFFFNRRELEKTRYPKRKQLTSHSYIKRARRLFFLDLIFILLIALFVVPAIIKIHQNTTIDHYKFVAKGYKTEDKNFITIQAYSIQKKKLSMDSDRVFTVDVLGVSEKISKEGLVPGEEDKESSHFLVIPIPKEIEKSTHILIRFHGKTKQLIVKFTKKRRS